MAMDVNVNLTLAQSTGTASFGVPLFAAADVVEKGEAAAAVPYTECTTLDDVVQAGFKNTSKLYAAVQLMLSQTARPRTFAVYGGTGKGILATSDDWAAKNWRQLITVVPGTSTVADVAAFVEVLEGKMYFTSITVADADTKTDEEFRTELAAAIGALQSYDRTVIMYYDNSVNTPEAALVGATAALSAGSFTYKNIILRGLAPLALKDSRINIISGADNTAHAITIVRKAGDIVTTEGKTAGGEYIDVIDSKDWIVQNIAYDAQALLNAQPKIPYTMPGITQLENVVLSILKTAFNNGMIASTEENDEVGDYSTEFAPVSEMTAADKANRHYTGGKFYFKLAGAIHTADINGTITV